MPSPYNDKRTVAKLVSDLEKAEKLSGRGKAYKRVCNLSHSTKTVSYTHLDVYKRQVETLPSS